MRKNPHVELGAFDSGDRDTLYQWINDRELVLFSASWKPVHGPNHDEWFQKITREPGRVIFAIRSVSETRLVGVVQLIDVNAVHRNAEMIIRIGDRENQSKGFGTEALKLLLDFAWRDANLHRVSARLFSENLRALRCYEKAGFNIEGTMKDAAFIDGRWIDVLFMGAINPKEKERVS